MIDSGALNMTQTAYPSNMVMANTASGGALLFLVMVITGVVVLMLLITSLERFTAFFKMFDKLIASIKYTLFGAGLVVLFYTLFVVCTLLAQFGSGVNPIHIGLGVAAYAFVTLLGWGAWKVVVKFYDMKLKYREQNPLPIKDDGT
jgi:hypothetical protein